jgi:tetratricopeptide (TPR) repeat protein
MKLPSTIPLEAFSNIPSRSQVQLIDILDSIEIGIWLTVLLLLIIIGLILYSLSMGKKKTSKNHTPEWSEIVETRFDQGKFKEAIQTLKTLEILYPNNAAIKWWYGRCCFLENEWNMSAQKFEECLRLDPYYKKSIRDCMSFIELNNLVVGVNGYLKANTHTSLSGTATE